MMKAFGIPSFGLACSLLLLGCSQENLTPENGVDFIPHDFVIRSSSDLLVDPERQLDALRRADPIEDARRAYQRRDCRLIANSPMFFDYLGVPENDPVVRLLVDRFEYKVIHRSEDLLKNAEFIELNHAYAGRYNKTLYELALKHGVPRR